MRQISSSPPYVFDNDCLSSFLWVKRTDILNVLFPGLVKVPDLVVHELSYLGTTKRAWVYDLLLHEIREGKFEVLSLPAASPAGKEFTRLICGGQGKAMGRGEAAVLAWVKHNGGTVASNNLADVANYCHAHGLNFICTDDILCKACLEGVFAEKEGNLLWEEMKHYRRKLPEYDFSEALRRFKAGEKR